LSLGTAVYHRIRHGSQLRDHMTNRNSFRIFVQIPSEALAHGVCASKAQDRVRCPLALIYIPLLTSFHSFKKARTIGPLYTGGPVALTQDGSRIVTCLGEEILFTNVATGTEICRFEGVRATLSMILFCGIYGCLCAGYYQCNRTLSHQLWKPPLPVHCVPHPAHL
jgi:hypothetical protein